MPTSYNKCLFRSLHETMDMVEAIDVIRFQSVEQRQYE
jgi:hypothetical protein